MVGIITTLIIVCFNMGILKSNEAYGILEWVYYITQPIMLLVTASAVFVALFGNEIRSLFIKEHCNVSLVNSGFYENLGRQNNTPNPVAQSYDCTISIKNDGSQEIERCEVILKSVYYKVKSEDKYKRIFSSEHKALYWNVPENRVISIVQNEVRNMPLYKIYPEASCQTPDDTRKSRMQMKVIGCGIEEKYSKKGIWKTEYEIHSQSKILCIFEVIAEWNGVWCNRSTEMDDHVSATINVLKK